MKLTKEERLSAVWLKISAHYEARLQALRQKNDGNLTAEETAKVRGRIAEAKAILALGAEENLPAPTAPAIGDE